MYVWGKILWRRAWQPSILAWRIPGTEEPGGLQSMGSQRVRHDWSYWASLHVCLKGSSGGSGVKNLPANARDMGSILGLGRSPGEGNGNTFQYSCLENPMEPDMLQSMESDKTWQLNNSNLCFKCCAKELKWPNEQNISVELLDSMIKAPQASVGILNSFPCQIIPILFSHFLENALCQEAIVVKTGEYTHLKMLVWTQ